MITFDDIQAAAPRVLERLKGMAPLPAHGIVAGQSVATLLFEELGLPIQGALNDIDVFVSKNLPAAQRQVEYTNTNTRKTFARSSRFSQWERTSVDKRKVVKVQADGTVDKNDYKFVNIIGQRGTISVLRTYRRGLLNYTLVDGAGMGPAGFVNVQVGQALVNGFDLNGVAVGIDLHTQKAVCSPQFVEFLNTRVLRPQSYHTPGYTLIRLAKKLFVDNMVGVSCDFDKEKDILLCASSLQQEKTWRLFPDATLLHTFGPKYHALLQGFSQHLPPVQEVRAPSSELHGLWAFAHPLPHAPKVAELTQGFAKVDANNTHFARSVLFTKHLTELWDATPAVRQHVFEQLATPAADQLALLETLRAPSPLPTVALKGFTPEQTRTQLEQSALTREEQARAVELFNALSEKQLNVFLNLQGELHEVENFATNEDDFYRRKFQQFGLRIFKAIGPKHPDVAERVYPLVMEQAATVEGRSIVRRTLETTWDPNTLPISVPKADCVQRLLSVALGKDLVVKDTDNSKMVFNLLDLAIRVDADLPASLPSFHAHRALRRMTHWPTVQHATGSLRLQQAVSMLLECVSDTDLAQTLLFGVVGNGGEGVFEARVRRMEDTAFEQLRAFNTTEVERRMYGAQKRDALDALAMFFERLALSRALEGVDTAVSAKPARRM